MAHRENDILAMWPQCWFVADFGGEILAGPFDTRREAEMHRPDCITAASGPKVCRPKRNGAGWLETPMSIVARGERLIAAGF